MSIISLSRSVSQSCPTSIDGCPIRPGFRNILRIHRLIGSPDVDERLKYKKAVKYFFDGEPPEDALLMMLEFMRAGADPSGEPEEQRIDFEFDADEIYSSFISEYGIDLLDKQAPWHDMHWYKFLVMLKGLSPKCALSRKTQIRFGDFSHLKGRERMEAEEAKEAVQIPKVLTAEELQEAQALEDEWAGVGE